MEKGENDIENYMEQLSEYLENGDFKSIRDMLSELSDDEIAELLDKTGNAENIAKILISLDSELAADVIMLLYPELRSKVVKYIPATEIAKFIENLPSDDAADLVSELEDEQIPEILEKLPQDYRAEIEELISHPEESAGAIMAHEVESLPGNYSVAQAIADLVRFGNDIEEIFQIFITDICANRFIFEKIVSETSADTVQLSSIEIVKILRIARNDYAITPTIIFARFRVDSIGVAIAVAVFDIAKNIEITGVEKFQKHSLAALTLDIDTEKPRIQNIIDERFCPQMLIVKL